MNVLILGKNEVNAEIAAILAGKGIGASIMSDSGEVLKLKAEPEGYAVTTPAGKSMFTSVIITEPPQFEALSACGQASVNLMDAAAAEKLLDLKTREKFVILLDYAEESHEYIVSKGVALALQLSGKKKDVVFLSKSVKSGYAGGELKCLKARKAGVNFIKYEELSVSYEAGTSKFKIDASDGVFDFNIATPYVISAISKDAPGLKSLFKKLRLPKNQHNMIYDGRFFLYPALSARRGIYYLNSALMFPHSGQNVSEIIFSIISDMSALNSDGYREETVKNFEFPEVDKDKCALCYSCYRACPHGAPEADIESSAMKIIETLCRSCGTCIAICPGKAIERKNAPKKQAGKGKYKIYCCENGAADAFAGILPLLSEKGHSFDREVIACGGYAAADMLICDIKDYETVLIACCQEDSCRHMDGDTRACKQAGRAVELLKKAKLESKRVEVIKVSHAMENVLLDNILNILEEGQI